MRLFLCCLFWLVLGIVLGLLFVGRSLNFPRRKSRVFKYEFVCIW